MTEQPKTNAFQNIDVGIEHMGSKIILPKEPHAMTASEARDILTRWEESENKTLDAMEVIEAFPLDAIVAFYKAMQRKYGLALPVDTPGLFGPKKPDILTVATGPKPNDKIQVPYGSFVVPGIEKPIKMVVQRKNDRPVLYVVGTVRKREQTVLMELANLARQIVRDESIYRGKPINLEADSDGSVNLMQPPTFMDVDDVDEQNLILPEGTRAQVEVSLFTPIKHTAACRAHKIPLKRGILLAGPYGTGKTLTARTAARIARDNGWTFVNLTRVEGLKEALILAEAYAPAVVFAEDIDRVMEDRDDDANDLVNTIDGILSKTSEVITVLTTNEINSIHPVMLRPGRLDAVIEILPPDAKAVGKLLRLYGRDLIGAQEDLTGACDALAGQIPATIREVVERSKLGMISRGDTTISDSDLVVAAQGMTAHLALLNKPRDAETDEEKLASSLRSVLGGVDNGMRHTLANMQGQLFGLYSELEDKAQQIVSKTAQNLGEVKGAVEEARDHTTAKLDATRKGLSAEVADAKLTATRQVQVSEKKIISAVEEAA